MRERLHYTCNAEAFVANYAGIQIILLVLTFFVSATVDVPGSTLALDAVERPS